MRRQEKEAVEQGLPSRFQGREGYEALLDSIGLRISVIGSRGKSDLVRWAHETFAARGLKVYSRRTGDDAQVVVDGEPVEPPEDDTDPDEVKWQVKKYWPIDVLVLENPETTLNGMRRFHEEASRPRYVLLTNVRHDHLEDLPKTLPLIAKAFAESIPEKAILISGEREAGLKSVLRAAVEARGGRFIDAAPKIDELPGLEAATLLDALHQEWWGERLSAEVQKKIRESYEREFQWRISSVPQSLWFPGAELKDPDSTRLVLERLLAQESRPVTFIACFRRDRPERTERFARFLEDMFREGVAVRAYLTGARAKQVQERLKPWDVRLVSERVKDLGSLMAELAKDCAGHAFFTLANPQPEWARELGRRLSFAPALVEHEATPHIATARTNYSFRAADAPAAQPVAPAVPVAPAAPAAPLQAAPAPESDVTFAVVEPAPPGPAPDDAPDNDPDDDPEPLPEPEDPEPTPGTPEPPPAPAAERPKAVAAGPTVLEFGESVEEPEDPALSDGLVDDEPAEADPESSAQGEEHAEPASVAEILDRKDLNRTVERFFEDLYKEPARYDPPAHGADSAHSDDVAASDGSPVTFEPAEAPEPEQRPLRVEDLKRAKAPAPPEPQPPVGLAERLLAQREGEEKAA